MQPQQLPLFPLNSVLFPGVPIFLHIFEPRYREMINRCIDERTPFGVVLIESGEEVEDVAVPFEIGCSAEIVQVERLEDGRMNIVAVGQDRFRIVSTDSTKSYLQGDVEPFPMQVAASKQQLKAGSQTLQTLITTYVEALREVSEVEVQWDALPEDPIELAYLAAYVLQVPTAEKQAFLANDQALETIRVIQLAYRKEIQLLNAMVTQQRLNPSATETIFSLN